MDQGPELDSKSRGPCGHEGSTPSFGTNRINDLARPIPAEKSGNKLHCT